MNVFKYSYNYKVFWPSFLHSRKKRKNNHKRELNFEEKEFLDKIKVEPEEDDFQNENVNSLEPCNIKSRKGS